MPKYLLSDVDLNSYKCRVLAFARMTSPDDGLADLLKNPIPDDVVIIQKADHEANEADLERLEGEVVSLGEALSKANKQIEKLKASAK